MLSTPYYLSNDQAKRYHTRKGEKALYSAAGLGAASYGVRKPQYRQATFSAMRSAGLPAPSFDVPHTVANAWGKALGFAAAGVGAYSGYHFGRAGHYNKKLKEAKLKKGATAAKKANGGIGRQFAKGGRKTNTISSMNKARKGRRK